MTVRALGFRAQRTTVAAMMRICPGLKSLLFAACLAVLLQGAPLGAAVRLPGIVGDGMVLQRDTTVRVWGWADPGERVTVAFRGASQSATTDPGGRWVITLGPLSAGGPDALEVVGTNRIVLQDVLVGDVWFCSGQSNMTHTFSRWREAYAREIAAADEPRIRQLLVPTQAVLDGPVDDVPGLTWKRATPEQVLDFTVVGYAFARSLLERYDVPQGIILSAVGGTRIEAWTSEAGLRDFSDLHATVIRNKDAAYVDHINAEARAAREADAPRGESDQGLSGPRSWYDPAYEPRNWKTINVPGYWEDQGVRALDGVVWYRREIEVPSAMTGVGAQLKLGRIRNADEVYINGRNVGRTTYEYPQRRYTIPAGVLEPGRNLIVVRVTNTDGKGGFISDKPYELRAAGQTLDLKGTWLYRVGETFAPRRPLPEGIRAQDQPAALYHGMVAPFTRYAMRGVLWYQGESNAGEPQAYARLLPNLISDWRRQWDDSDLAFLIAQLPRYMDVDYLPAESNWARMREVQLETARRVPHTGLGINIDLGEWNDIHPGDKMIVGERLALQAMRIVFHDTGVVSSGPVFRTQEIRDGRIVLQFDHVGGGLVTRDGEPPGHFAIAGEDLDFRWARAAIEGDTVVVWHDDVPEPRYVRYAWADNPDFANLANREGLPASPFRTDR